MNNLTLICGTPVHIDWLVGFNESLLLGDNLKELVKYTDLIFYINNSHDSEDLCASAGDKGHTFFNQIDSMRNLGVNVKIVYNPSGGYESAAYQYIKDHCAQYKYALFLPCSVEIHDAGFWKLCFDNEEEYFLDRTRNAYMYKLLVNTIAEFVWPKVNNKKEVCQLEGKLKGYFQLWHGPMNPETNDSRWEIKNLFFGIKCKTLHGQQKYGRLNLVNRNKYISKYRGCWSHETFLAYLETKWV